MGTTNNLSAADSSEDILNGSSETAATYQNKYRKLSSIRWLFKRFSSWLHRVTSVSKLLSTSSGCSTAATSRPTSQEESTDVYGYLKPTFHLFPTDSEASLPPPTTTTTTTAAATTTTATNLSTATTLTQPIPVESYSTGTNPESGSNPVTAGSSSDDSSGYDVPRFLSVPRSSPARSEIRPLIGTDSSVLVWKTKKWKKRKQTFEASNKTERALSSNCTNSFLSKQSKCLNGTNFQKCENTRRRCVINKSHCQIKTPIDQHLVKLICCCHIFSTRFLFFWTSRNSFCFNWIPVWSQNQNQTQNPSSAGFSKDLKKLRLNLSLGELSPGSKLELSTHFK